MNSIKGYKVFNSDWTCRGFQYEVGKIYKHEGEIEICEEGFHFCKKLSSCFSYYEFDPNNKVAEVEALGLVKAGDNKSVTNRIKIVRELNWNEVLNIVNSGKGNTGYCNTGNKNTGNNNSGFYNTGNNNSGNNNSGHYNSGFYNTGNNNSGHYNSGCGNSGNRNSGHNNTGDNNSGNWNSGYRNSGYCNKGNYNTGVFNTATTSNIYMFNKLSEWTIDDWESSEAREILEYNCRLTEWVCTNDMTDEEKEENPDYDMVGGYLKIFTYKEMYTNMWKSLVDEEKEVIKALPNFNKDVFEEITGIRL